MKLVHRSVALTVLTLLLSGCDSRGPQTYTVSGSVTFDGTSVADGQIVFRDEAGQIPTAAGPIAAGQFSFSSQAGPKRVEITAMRDIPGKMDRANPGESVPAREMYIPAVYNTKSTLTAEVSPSGKNQFTFELKSKP
ncbi:MAG: hypothetical protein ABFD16_01180 [Thermoguttaceae bacterium]|jgi:hypothetical protein